MTAWHTIEGTWSGYRSEQRRVVHREYTRSKNHIADVESIGHAIYYTDGTRLDLSIRKGKHGDPINGYGTLIRQCIYHKTNRVSELP